MKNTSLASLATTALQLFRDNCYIKVRDRVRDAILNQIRRDRDSEMVDLGLVKASIYTFVEMGFISGDIVKQDDEFIWKGDKNNETHYNANFAKQLLDRVSTNIELDIIDQRVLLQQGAGLVHEP